MIVQSNKIKAFGDIGAGIQGAIKKRPRADSAKLDVDTQMLNGRRNNNLLTNTKTIENKPEEPKT